MPRLLYTNTEEFELILTTRETEILIAPEFIEIVAQKNEHPAIKRFLRYYGTVMFALAYDLMNAHNE